jgi:4-amino-4-deoxy-L-arabinose transferase-like glycosyltransferase
MFYPAVIIADGRGGPESFYMLSIAVTFAFLYKAVNNKKTIYFFYFGLALGFALLLKSTLALLPMTLLIFLIFYEKGKSRISYTINSVLISSAATGLILSPWIVRNYALTSEFIPTTSITGVAIFQGYHINNQSSFSEYLSTNLKAAKAQQNIIANDLNLKFVQKGLFQYFYNARDELLFSDHLTNIAYSEYLKSPSLLAKGIFGNALGFWFRGKTLNSTILNLFAVIPLLIITIHGALIAYRNKYKTAVLFLIIITVFIPHIFLIGLARYHTPIVPLLAILSSFSISSVLRQWPIVNHLHKGEAKTNNNEH